MKIMIQVTIKTLDNQNKVISVEDGATVGELKNTIREEMDISINLQRLIFAGKMLEDDQKLAECEVNGKVIHLVPRPPPVSSRHRAHAQLESGHTRDDGGGGPPRPAETDRHASRPVFSPGPRVVFEPPSEAVLEQRYQSSLGPVAGRLDFVRQVHQETRNSLDFLDYYANVNTSGPGGNKAREAMDVDQAGPSTRRDRREAETNLPGPSTSHADEPPQRYSVNPSYLQFPILNGPLPRRREPLPPSRSILARPCDYAALLQETMQLQARFAPHQESYIRILRDYNTAQDLSSEEVIRRNAIIELAGDTMHSLAHIYHVFSDLELNIGQYSNTLNADAVVDSSHQRPAMDTTAHRVAHAAHLPHVALLRRGNLPNISLPLTINLTERMAASQPASASQTASTSQTVSASENANASGVASTSETANAPGVASTSQAANAPGVASTSQTANAPGVASTSQAANTLGVASTSQAANTPGVASTSQAANAPVVASTSQAARASQDASTSQTARASQDASTSQTARASQDASTSQTANAPGFARYSQPINISQDIFASLSLPLVQTNVPLRRIDPQFLQDVMSNVENAFHQAHSDLAAGQAGGQPGQSSQPGRGTNPNGGDNQGQTGQTHGQADAVRPRIVTDIENLFRSLSQGNAGIDMMMSIEEIQPVETPLNFSSPDIFLTDPSTEAYLNSRFDSPPHDIDLNDLPDNDSPPNVSFGSYNSSPFPPNLPVLSSPFNVEGAPGTPPGLGISGIPLLPDGGVFVPLGRSQNETLQSVINNVLRAQANMAANLGTNEINLTNATASSDDSDFPPNLPANPSQDFSQLDAAFTFSPNVTANIGTPFAIHSQITYRLTPDLGFAGQPFNDMMPNSGERPTSFGAVRRTTPGRRRANRDNNRSPLPYAPGGNVTSMRAHQRAQDMMQYDRFMSCNSTFAIERLNERRMAYHARQAEAVRQRAMRTSPTGIERLEQYNYNFSTRHMECMMRLLSGPVTRESRLNAFMVAVSRPLYLEPQGRGFAQPSMTIPEEFYFVRMHMCHYLQRVVNTVIEGGGRHNLFDLTASVIVGHNLSFIEQMDTYTPINELLGEPRHLLRIWLRRRIPNLMACILTNFTSDEFVDRFYLVMERFYTDLCAFGMSLCLIGFEGFRALHTAYIEHLTADFESTSQEWVRLLARELLLAVQSSIDPMTPASYAYQRTRMLRQPTPHATPPPPPPRNDTPDTPNSLSISIPTLSSPSDSPEPNSPPRHETVAIVRPFDSVPDPASYSPMSPPDHEPVASPSYSPISPPDHESVANPASYSPMSPPVNDSEVNPSLYSPMSPPDHESVASPSYSPMSPPDHESVANPASYSPMSPPANDSEVTRSLYSPMSPPDHESVAYPASNSRMSPPANDSEVTRSLYSPMSPPDHESVANPASNSRMSPPANDSEVTRSLYSPMSPPDHESVANPASNSRMSPPANDSEVTRSLYSPMSPPDHESVASPSYSPMSPPDHESVANPASNSRMSPPANDSEVTRSLYSPMSPPDHESVADPSYSPMSPPAHETGAGVLYSLPPRGSEVDSAVCSPSSHSQSPIRSPMDYDSRSMSPTYNQPRFFTNSSVDSDRPSLLASSPPLLTQDEARGASEAPRFQRDNADRPRGPKTPPPVRSGYGTETPAWPRWVFDERPMTTESPPLVTPDDVASTTQPQTMQPLEMLASAAVQQRSSQREVNPPEQQQDSSDDVIFVESTSNISSSPQSNRSTNRSPVVIEDSDSFESISDSDTAMEAQGFAEGAAATIPMTPTTTTLLAHTPPQNYTLNFDEELVPVLNQDQQLQQERDRPQEPFSDAYLTGMPARKRRRILAARPTATLEAIYNEIRAAVEQVPPLESDLFRYRLLDSVRSVVQERAHASEDYTSTRFAATSHFCEQTPVSLSPPPEQEPGTSQGKPE